MVRMMVRMKIDNGEDKDANDQNENGDNDDQPLYYWSNFALGPYTSSKHLQSNITNIIITVL